MAFIKFPATDVLIISCLNLNVRGLLHHPLTSFNQKGVNP